MMNPGTQISRRDLLRASAAALALPAMLQRVAAQRPLPNILWLVSEDNTTWLGCYGDKLARTPNIDALAKRGVLYRNAYCNTPVCAPSRFTILTGLQAQSCSPAMHMSTIASLPPEFKTYPEVLREAGYYTTNNLKTGWNVDRLPKNIFDESGPNAHYRHRPAGRPFFHIQNDMTSHEGSVGRQRKEPITPDQVTVPGYLPDTPEVRGDIAAYYNAIGEMDGNIGKWLAELEASGAAEDTIVFYYADNGGAIARTKRYVNEAGSRVPLIVYVPPKWQELTQTKPGTEVTDPVSFVDLFPTLLTLLGQERPAHLQGRSLLGPRREQRRFAVTQSSRADERYDFVRSITDGRYRLMRNYTPHRPESRLHIQTPASQRALKSWRREYQAGRLNPVQRAFWDADLRRFEEFYDVREDFWQVHNLIDDKAHAAKAQEFRQALDRQMLEITDNGFIPEGSPVEGYRASRDPKAYPLERLMDIGRRVGQKDAKNVAFFRSGLSDANPIVRYWSAQGLLAVKAAAAPAKADLVRLVKEDPSVHVQIAAAEAAVWVGEAQLGVEKLVAIMDPAHPEKPFPVPLQAIESLSYLGEHARPALADVQRMVEATRDVHIYKAAKYLEVMLTGTFTDTMSFNKPGLNPAPDRTLDD